MDLPLAMNFGSYVLLFLNVISAFLLVIISLQVFKFVNITKKNRYVVIIYFLLSLIFVSSVMNIIYFFFQDSVPYYLVNLIDKSIILIVLIIIAVAYSKFRKIISIKKN